MQQFLNGLLERLRRPSDAFEYEVRVLQDGRANAFALPGGRIYLLSGLIEKSETPEEVAGILAHEMAHVSERHGIRALLKSAGVMALAGWIIGSGLEGVELAEGVAELASTLIYLSYSRSAEQEADQQAVERLRNARISLQGFIDFFERGQLREQGGHAVSDPRTEPSQPTLGWLSTHPLDETRSAYLRRSRELQSAGDIAAPRALLPADQSWQALKTRCKVVSRTSSSAGE